MESSSGSINYLRVEYAGAIAENGKNFDAVSFYGVGAFTNITNVQTFESLGNGIRFIGGNADAEQLAVTQSGGSSVVVQDDWSGNGESWYLTGGIKSGIEITSIAPESLILQEIDTISKVSVIGPTLDGAIRYADEGGSYLLTNIFTKNLSLGVNVEGATASEQVDMGNLRIDSIQFSDPTNDFIPTNYTGPNSNFYMESANNGAGSQDQKPEWANGWTVGLD